MVEGWERFARRILDTENLDLFISGSSARMLSREVATSMRGRAMEALVFPFSFREFLRHHGREIRDPERATKAERSALRRDLEIYLTVGGFPEAQGVSERDRWQLLRGYVDATLLRDVIERHGISHPLALRQLVRHLLAHAAGFFSMNRFYNDLKSQGVRIAKDSLHAYLGHLEDAFLVYGVWLVTNSERRRMSNPRKIYPVDPGLVPIFDRMARGAQGAHPGLCGGSGCCYFRAGGASPQVCSKGTSGRRSFSGHAGFGINPRSARNDPGL